jgi:Undecaprenyl-phosphate glucose phosphotransferase
MVVFEDTVRDVSGGLHSRPSSVRRAVICLIAGAIEAVAAASLVYLVAIAYHFAVLQIDVAVFDHLSYLLFAGLAGAVYGTFSAIACERILTGEHRLEWALSTSLYGWTAAVGITLLSAFLAGSIGELSRVTLTAAFVLGSFALLLVRGVVRGEILRRVSNGELHFERVAVIGRRADVADFLVNADFWRRGHVLTGTMHIEDHVDADGALRERDVTDFARQNLRLGADHVLLLGDLGNLQQLERLVETIKRFALNFVVAPATSSTTLKILDVVSIGPNNALRFVRKPLSDPAVLLKRATDTLLSFVGLLVLTPLFLLVALAIVLDTRGPVIYRQARRGFNGEVFMIWKFRTMTVTESGFSMKQADVNDSRVTTVGRILRRTSIDELPQLVNVLLGQMSLVGPRPHAVSHDDELEQQIATYAHRQRIKPGITGWAQVNGFRGETKTMQQIEGRVVHDIFYIENWSLFLDFWILLLTVVSPAARRNAR